jgi:hypothetical protein
LVQLIITEGEFCDGANDGDFSRIGEGWPSTRNSKIAELNHLASFSIDFKETITAMSMFIDEADQFFLERFHAQGIPFSIIRIFDIDQTELTN